MKKASVVHVALIGVVLEIEMPTIGRKFTLARYQKSNGGIPEPPQPAYAVMLDGTPYMNLTTEDMDEVIDRLFTIKEIKTRIIEVNAEKINH